MAEPTLVNIEAGDAALVFKTDGVELIVPGFDEEGVKFPSHVVEACAAAMLLRGDDPRFFPLRAQLESLFKESCKDAESEDG